MKNLFRTISKSLFIGSLMTTLLVAPVSAHVVVRPAEVLTGAFQTFTVGVPNEKEVSTVRIKVLIPENAQYVTPTAKPGWTITTEKTGTGETAKVTSITWSDGAVVSGQRDDFTFSAKVPDSDSQLEWKAYQTYADGTEVAWDSKEESEEEGTNKGPLSVTKVVSQTAQEKTNAEQADTIKKTKSKADTAFSLAIFTLVVSLLMVARSRRSN